MTRCSIISLSFSHTHLQNEYGHRTPIVQEYSVTLFAVAVIVEVVLQYWILFCAQLLLIWKIIPMLTMISIKLNIRMSRNVDSTNWFLSSVFQLFFLFFSLMFIVFRKLRCKTFHCQMLTDFVTLKCVQTKTDYWSNLLL